MKELKCGDKVIITKTTSLETANGIFVGDIGTVINFNHPKTNDMVQLELQNHPDRSFWWIEIDSVELAEFMTPEQAIIEHDLKQRVDKFSKAMLDKLIKKSRDGWNNWEKCNPDVFRNGLRHHIEKGDPIDVANFAFFLNEMGESTAFN